MASTVKKRTFTPILNPVQGKSEKVYQPGDRIPEKEIQELEYSIRNRLIMEVKK